MGTQGETDQKTLAPDKVAEQLRRQKEIDDWLPITSSRNAKWWYAAFHNVTAMVGAGVLSLPYAMAQLGWGPGVVILILSWLITLYTLWQMVEMHEMVPGKRFDRYHELGQHAFGEKLGLYIVVPQQLIVEIGVDIVYMVTGGKSLQKVHYLLYAMPVFDMIETVLVTKLHFKPTTLLRFVTRNLYVAFTMFVAISFPFFGGLLGFFGGFAFAPTTYFLPCIMWLAVYKPKKFSLSWFANWICIILGLLLMILAPIGALRSIILQAKDYKFYS
ncbi:hypothetical protein Ddye_000115 [Dipteronia dyeriana]|uniref:Amino acid transporter transmembrane domain-containing protein n=1 Tax=Dipteronia dyeriana TaxID=168575 RepID=A0AAE0CS99_9ROSI|nr:hypothetical protein Ddye_000115 [Dipteronia dyeriana]